MPRMLIALFAAGLLSPAGADELTYRYADAVVVSQEGNGDDWEGLGLRGSLPVHPGFYAAAEFYITSLDDIDRTDFALGAGYHFPLNRNTDFFGQLDYVNVDTDVADDDGLRVGAGVRSMVAEQLEVRGAVRYLDVTDGELILELGAQYNFTPGWAAFIEVSEGDDVGGSMIGLRLNL